MIFFIQKLTVNCISGQTWKISAEDEGGGSGSGGPDPNSGLLGQVVHSVAHTAAGAVYIPPCKCDTGKVHKRVGEYNERG